MAKPYILITNDDGIRAKGIKHLWQALSEFTDVDLAIVAPVREASGSGLAITWKKPLHIEETPWENDCPAWSLTGTPADCVKMAVCSLLPKPPDLIVSGINEGSNSGRTVLYSGTVGGVIEGALKGIPGIAFSFTDLTPPPLEATKKYITSLVRYFLKHPMPRGSCLNVNFPERAHERILGLRFAKQGQGYHSESPIMRTHPAGFPYYWLGGKWLTCEEHPESDVALLEQGYVTAVPIHIGDLTDEDFLKAHQQSFDEHINA